MIISSISFLGIPKNYAVVDKYVSRSAQPLKDDFSWLKDNGVTDIINFRTMYAPGINFDEKTVVEDLGMNYHNIPSSTNNPDEKNIRKFLNIVNKIKEKSGKVHIHCMAGADRTGMYAFIYKTLNSIGLTQENEAEWIRMGHDKERYPDLISRTKIILKNLISD